MRRLGIIAIVLIFLACEGTGSPGNTIDPNGEPVEVTGIRINQQEELIMALDATLVQITATVLPVDATNRGIIWEVSDPDIIELTGTGTTRTIRAIALGTSTLTVTTDDGDFEASTEITVVNPIQTTSLTITPQDPYVSTAIPGVLTIVTTPEGAPNTVTWSSSNPLVATASGNLITGHSVGTATLIATSTMTATTINASVTVNVTAPPEQGQGAVTRLALLGLNPDDGEEEAITFFEANANRAGTRISPYLIGNVARDYTIRLTLEAMPRDASNQRVKWTAPENGNAVIVASDTNHEQITIRGVNVGSAVFMVESESNPDVVVYFFVRVIDPIQVQGVEFLPASADFPEWNDPSLDGNGTSAGNYLTLGLGDAERATGTFSVRLFSADGIPSNLNLSTSITPPGLNSSVRVEQLRSNQMTGIVDFRVTALTGTRGEPAIITFGSQAAPGVTPGVANVRVLQPFGDNNTASIGPAESPVGTTGPIMLTNGVPRAIRAGISNFFPIDDVASFQWDDTGSHDGSLTFNNPSANPVQLTFTGTDADGLEVGLTVTDYFGNELTAFNSSFILVQ
ncbi:MAG: Ig-like domain-containing protein [Treponema sp.]|nr:Ig-like domain-containing protein [Treponema sp.]